MSICKSSLAVSFPLYEIKRHSLRRTVWDSLNSRVVGWSPTQGIDVCCAGRDLETHLSLVPLNFINSFGVVSEPAQARRHNS
jgi:hypothetical protein